MFCNSHRTIIWLKWSRTSMSDRTWQIIGDSMSQAVFTLVTFSHLFHVTAMKKEKKASCYTVVNTIVWGLRMFEGIQHKYNTNTFHISQWCTKSVWWNCHWKFTKPVIHLRAAHLMQHVSFKCTWICPFGYFSETLCRFCWCQKTASLEFLEAPNFSLSLKPHSPQNKLSLLSLHGNSNQQSTCNTKQHSFHIFVFDTNILLQFCVCVTCFWNATWEFELTCKNALE